MRAVVLDTNIVLDLLVFADPASAPLSWRLQNGRLRWIATAPMRAELARVLAYPKVAPRVACCGLTADQVLARFDAAVQQVQPAPPITVLCKDRDDQALIDLAAQHRALLLSKDKAVLALRKRLLGYGVDAACGLQGHGHHGTPPVPGGAANLS